MSALLARIMLVIFMLPAASVLYTVYVVTQRDSRWLRNLVGYSSNMRLLYITAGLITWAFVAVYWWLIWRKQIRWTATRTTASFVVTLIAIAVGVLVFWLIRLTLRYDREFSSWAGSVVAPIAWLIGTTLAWRETAAERAERVGSGSSLACPTCGYNLTGLKGTRCPECGNEFTLDELLASRDGRGDSIG